MAASVARRGMAARIVEEKAGCELCRRRWADVGAALGVAGAAVDLLVGSVGILTVGTGGGVGICLVVFFSGRLFLCDFGASANALGPDINTEKRRAASSR